MTEVVEFALDDGGVLRVQAAAEDAAGSALGPASPGERLVRASGTLDDALAVVMPALRSVTGKLRALSPDDLAVEFGLTLSAESGVVVAKGSAEVHFTVTLGWGQGRASRDEADA